MERKEHNIELVVIEHTQNMRKKVEMKWKEKTTTGSLTKFQRTASVCIIHAINVFFPVSASASFSFACVRPYLLSLSN